MEKKYDIILAIDTCVDILLDCGQIKPVYGQTEQLIPGYNIELGGSAGIFACGMSKLGMRVAGIGTVGADIFGTYVKEVLGKSGVSIKNIYTDERVQTGVGVALCMSDHDRAILTYNGTIGEVRAVDFSEKLLAQTKHIHIGSYFLMEKLQSAYPNILAKAKKYGVTVSLDTNWDPKEKWDSGLLDIFPYVDVFLPNAKEAMAIAGTDDIESAATKLAELVPVIALKEGRKGARVYAGKTAIRESSAEVNVVDTVGAGDNFDVGFIYGFLHGYKLDECLKLGCFCGSMSTCRAGGIKGQVTKRELAVFLGENVGCYLSKMSGM